MTPRFTDYELVQVLWAVAPAGAKIVVSGVYLWVIRPEATAPRLLLRRRELPADLERLAVSDPEGFIRAMGRLAYGDDDAFTPE